jgi:hypothetical protein
MSNDNKKQAVLLYYHYVKRSVGYDYNKFFFVSTFAAKYTTHAT